MPSYTLYYFNGRGRAEVIRMMFGAAGAQFTDKRYEFSEWEKYRNEMPSYCMPVLEIDGKNRVPETMAICRHLAREFGFYGKTNMEMFRIDYISDCLYEIMHDYMRYFHEKNGRFRYSMSSTMASNTKGNMASNVKSGMSISATSSMSSSMKSNMSSNPNSSMSTDMKTNMSSNPNSKMGPAMSSTGSYMQMRFMDSCRRIMPFLERTLNVYCCGNQFFMGEHLMMCDMMLYCFLESPMMECHSMFQSYPKVMALWKRVGTHPKIASYLKTRINSNW